MIRRLDIAFHISLGIFIFPAVQLGLMDPGLISIYSPLTSVLDILILALIRYRFINYQVALYIVSMFFAELKCVINILSVEDGGIINDYSTICLLSFVICLFRFIAARRSEASANEPITWTRLFRFTTGHWKRLMIGIGVLLVRLPFSLAVPHYVSEGIGGLIERDYGRLEHGCIMLFATGTMDAILDFGCVYLFATAQQEIVFSLRSSLFRSILFHPLKFFDVTAVGELQSRLNADTAEMANDLSWVFRFAIEAIVRVGGVVGYMFYASWRLAVLVLFLVPLNAVASTYLGQWMSRNSKAAQDLLAVTNTIANESFGSIQTVKSFHAENHALSKYKESLTNYKILQYKAAVVTSTYYMFVSTFLMNTVMQTSIVAYGGFLAWHKMIATERLVSFMLYRGQLQDYATQLMNTYVNLVKCAGLSDRVFGLISGSGMSPDEDIGQILPPDSLQLMNPKHPGPPSIEFKNVCMRYSNRLDVEVLKSVSFRINPGSCTGIVGQSGSGKSSVLSLLLRLYQPVSGRVTINETTIDWIPLRILRGRLISIVSQEPVLFRGTLRENILYSLSQEQLQALSDGTIDDLILRATRIAWIADFIDNLPDKLETKIGDRGVTLSGGQKQRIAIARAIIANPPILLLDEAMSALDPESEDAVQKALQSAMKERTTVMVSHRISTVIDIADNCIVMHKGNVVEQGNPRELLKKTSEKDTMSLRTLYDIQQRCPS
jgi:ABC-type multidrug transport system fused ATPase/permease subunit